MEAHKGTGDHTPCPGPAGTSIWLGPLKRDAGHPDFKHLTGKELQNIEQRARMLAPTYEPTIPAEVLPTDLADVSEAQNGC